MVSMPHRAPRLTATYGQRALGAAVGLIADRLLGEPPVPNHVHPVAMLGSVATALERWLYADDRRHGVAYAGLNTALGLTAGAVVRSPAMASYVATSGRTLHDHALSISEALESGDIDRARALLPNLVGRETDGLDPSGIARAVVESVAENTVDAIVAPALWTLAGGAAGTFAHRVADSIDSMVGYPDARYGRFGTAGARLDDILAWVPARCTALLVALVRPPRARAVLATVCRDAAAHPSPNAGVVEAAFAGALGIRLGGPNRYGGREELRPVMGDGSPASPADISPAVALSRDVSWALAALLVGAGGALHTPWRHLPSARRLLQGWRR
jgi:adenosylcobinamide-phosphate synthase